jgi:hypothetical protein
VRIFISYNTPDRPTAEAVAAALTNAPYGADCFVVPRSVAAGAYWVPRLAQEIERSDAMVFLAGGKIGPWQELEYYEALRLSRECNRPRLIPVVLAPKAPGLLFFPHLHQIFNPDPVAADGMAAIIGQALADGVVADEEPAWQRFRPYKGLHALEEADAAFFFGREAETADIFDHMARRPERIVALIGDPGVGKSSLARAGVLARLKSQLWPVAGGAWPAALADSREFLSLVVRPEEAPLKALAYAFAALYGTRSFEIDEEAAGWARRFADGASLHDMLCAAREHIADALDAAPPKRFVVYVDQGEELYARTAAAEARRFSSLLAEAAGFEAFSVLISLQSDYYAAYQDDRESCSTPPTGSTS